MKFKSKKIMIVLASAVLTAALTCGTYTDISTETNYKSASFVVCAAGSETDMETDIYYIVVDELDDDGKYCQWYTNDDIAFNTNGVTVKLDGVDVTSKCSFSFDKGVTPSEVYDGVNFDYEVPIKITSSNYDIVEAKLPVKIGQEGDVNLDHVVDVRDSSAITRDIEYFSQNKKSLLEPFGQFLGTPENMTSSYKLDMTKASGLAKTLAKESIQRATGEKLERKGESEYSLSISNAVGFPGQTVTMQVVIDADDTFESLDALIEWDDDTLKSAAAVSVNGTLCESYAENGMVSIVDYSSGGVKDGAIASIDFVIPENAKPNTNLEVYFSEVKTFGVYDSGVTSNISNVVNVAGATIGVLEPKETTTAVTTAAPTTQTTVSTTVTSSPIVAVPIEQGDANLDGKVDIRDAAYIALLLSRGESSVLPNVADYNYDGVKNIRDAAAIAKFLSIKYQV